MKTSGTIRLLERAAFRLKGVLPTSLERLVDSGAHKLWPSRKPIHGTTATETFSGIYSDSLWESGGGSRSGLGSTAVATTRLREALPRLWARYGIRTVLDAPCGDWAWMKDVDTAGVTYLGYDIVDSVIEENRRRHGSVNVSFCVADITKDDLPAADMIICKDCLQHLSYDSAIKALNNFRRSGSKYLLTTSYRLTLLNHDIRDGGYRAVNLTRRPFFLPENRVLEAIQEEARAPGIEPDKCMYLWLLDDLRT